MRTIVCPIAFMIACTLCARAACAAEAPPKVMYAQVRVVMEKHCLSCHDAKQAEGELVMESFESLMKGGDKGPAVLPGRADESLLVLAVEHKKKPFMPPKKARDTLTEQEIALFREWVEGGAPGPRAGEAAPLAVTISAPTIRPTVAPRKPVRAITYAPREKFAAIARDAQVEIISVMTRDVIRRLEVQKGNVNALTFSTDGSKLVAGAGQAGVAGEIDIWGVADGALLRHLEGHKDAVYSVALSPDGKTLASGGYDSKIILWDVDSGKPARTLEGHNGAILGLAFRPDGNVLASASGDRTVKLWDVKTGERLDTFGESLKELNTVLFSPDGQRVIAAGGDNRIRVWQVSASAKEGTNKLLVAQFAHEGSILRLALSSDGKTLASAADDKTVKLWDAEPDSSSGSPELKELRALPPQPDWPAALASAADNKVLLVGRLDGSVTFYDPHLGTEIPPPKPELVSVEPRGVQRGQTLKLQLKGKHLNDLTNVWLSDPKLSARIVPEESGRLDVASLELTSTADLASGAYELKVRGPGGESGPVNIFVDDLPQVWEKEPNDSTDTATVASLPADFWGRFDHRGDIDHFAFDATAGQPIVVDAAAQRLGSKAKLLVELLDPSGKLVVSSNGFDSDLEPLLAYTPTTNGRYVARITELEAAASEDHFYRLSAGSFAYVTGCYPLAVAPNIESKVQLLGLNCHGAWASVKASASGEADVPIDSSKYRTRRPVKVMIGPGAEPTEVEPNDKPEEATPISVPGAINGRIDHPGDVDLFRFEAKAGQTYVLETLASRRSSPADTKIEVLHPDGSPVERVQLRAVRDSAITFRGFDANAGGGRLLNWEEMDLNQYLYLSGEVVKLFRTPRGPDSEYDFYTINGRRRCYFDTTATAHALDEHCYIVEPHKAGEKLPPNGLPVFTIYYANDDDPDRKLGADSHLLFTAPADGPYLVRVTDARGFGGERYVYRLSIHSAAADFNVSLGLSNPAVPAGSGVRFTVNVDRIDGFDGPVKVQFTGVPPGFAVSTPIVVEAGHTEANGALYAREDAVAPNASNESQTKAVATAMLEGREVTRPVNGFGKIVLAPQPELSVGLDPADAPTTRPAADWDKPAEITVAPGQFTPARLWIRRHNFKGEVTFEVDNLPHGVIVADIGLNGVLIPEDKSERQIFLHTAPWVADTDRLGYARAIIGGGITSAPVLIHVRRPVQQAQSH